MRFRKEALHVAAMVERAKIGSADLDLQVFRLTVPEGRRLLMRGQDFTHLPPATQFMDAARLLLPPGDSWGVTREVRANQAPGPWEAWCGDGPRSNEVGFGADVALAMCAAFIKRQAMQVYWPHQAEKTDWWDDDAPESFRNRHVLMMARHRPWDDEAAA